jgi:hypothetical protein
MIALQVTTIAQDDYKDSPFYKRLTDTRETLIGEGNKILDDLAHIALEDKELDPSLLSSSNEDQNRRKTAIRLNKLLICVGAKLKEKTRNDDLAPLNIQLETNSDNDSCQDDSCQNIASGPEDCEQLFSSTGTLSHMSAIYKLLSDYLTEGMVQGYIK